MKFINKDHSYIIALKKGEKIIQSIKKICAEQKIQAGYFNAIGAISEVDLGFYNLKLKQYTTKAFTIPLEIASMNGNISTLDEQITIHCHGVFSKKDFSTIAGHVNEAVVAATCEIFITELEININRKYNEKIGLNLLN